MYSGRGGCVRAWLLVPGPGHVLVGVCVVGRVLDVGALSGGIDSHLRMLPRRSRDAVQIGIKECKHFTSLHRKLYTERTENSSRSRLSIWAKFGGYKSKVWREFHTFHIDKRRCSHITHITRKRDLTVRTCRTSHAGLNRRAHGTPWPSGAEGLWRGVRVAGHTYRGVTPAEAHEALTVALVVLDARCDV